MPKLSKGTTLAPPPAKEVINVDIATVKALMVAGGDLTLTSENETSQWTAMAFYSDATKQDVTASATWESSDPAVASVSNSGLVTALYIGTSNIKATFQGQSNSVKITRVSLW